MRFVLHEKPIAMPRRDIIKKTADGPVFDLGIILEHYTGAVYVQQLHIEEMAKSVGMLTKADAEHLYKVIENLQAENKKLVRNAEELRNGIDSAINRFYTDAGDAPVVPEKPIISEPKAAPRSEGNARQSNGTAFKQGPDGVHANTVNESDTGFLDPYIN